MYLHFPRLGYCPPATRGKTARLGPPFACFGRGGTRGKPQTERWSHERRSRELSRAGIWQNRDRRGTAQMNQKPPPLLLGAALLFWGWQTGFFFAGALMAIVLEAAHVVKVRWDLTHADFSRLWAFCSVVFLATIVYAFTSNEGPADFRGFFENPSFLTQRNAGAATARTAAALFRWLPMSFFLFIAAQQYSAQGAIPLQTVSLLLSLRWRKARKLGQSPGPVRYVNIGYFYFALCLFAASIHVSEDEKFFWGVCVLMTWALWPQRSRRFAFPLWAV